jgi:uncharacterized membrane protein required for colicin V production
MEKIPVDFIIFAIILLTAYSGFKRGFFKESLISIAYIPYVTALFYIVNEFIQDHYTFDSILYKISSLGGFYLAYLFGIWLLAKSLKFRLENIDESLIYLGKIFASIISGLRTVYFCLLCLLAFNLHIHDKTMIEKSKLATAAQPTMLKVQKYLISKGYIKNEITLYDDAINGTFNAAGKYEHPLMKKIKSSDKFKELEQSINKEKILRQFNNYMN